MQAHITININGKDVQTESGISVAAALARSGLNTTRISVTGEQRAPVCGMGICQECRVTINGQAHKLACQTLCIDGMKIETLQSSAQLSSQQQKQKESPL
ncbi:MAG: (2Fe-2S)-binding protein [Burkholderiales bacterium]|nr:(2Fe-2S)-binding protein [Burkholderiales bacterium]